jgi:hypothetical protein
LISREEREGCEVDKFFSFAAFAFFARHRFLPIIQNDLKTRRESGTLAA